MNPHRPAAAVEIHSWAAKTLDEEAEVVATSIENLVKRGYRYRDIAILCVQSELHHRHSSMYFAAGIFPSAVPVGQACS